MKQLFTFLVCFTCALGFSQAPDIDWSLQPEYGSIVAAPDGGIFMASVVDAQLMLQHYDADGEITWAQPYETAVGLDVGLFGFIATSDDALIIRYYVFNDEDYEFEIDHYVKVSLEGELIWEVEDALPSLAYSYSLAPTNDGGFITAAAPAVRTKRFSESGSLVWEHTYDNPEGAWSCITPATDGGFLVIGEFYDEEFNNDPKIGKLDSEGELLWLEDIGSGMIYGLVEMGDGSIMASGMNPPTQAIVYKFDALGNEISLTTLEGGWYNVAFGIIKDADGIVIYGNTEGADFITDYHGDNDIWLARLDNDGTLVWAKAFGGSGGDGFSDYTSALIQTTDGNLAFLGYTASTDGDLNEDTVEFGSWLVKLGPETLGVAEAGLVQNTAYPNPTTGLLRFTTTMEKAEIFSLNGQKLREAYNTDNLQLESLAQGLYLLKAKTNNGASHIQKIVKE